MVKRSPRKLPGWIVSTVIAGACSPVLAQTSVTGSSLALRSAASATLTTNAYAGTYLTIPAGGATVNLTVNATLGAGTGTPHLNVAVADSLYGFNVASTSATNYTTSNLTLPAGTYFIRNERDYAANVGNTRPYTINSLSVSTVTGGAATFSNTDNDTNATASATTYINNFRKGNATVALTGTNSVPLLPGTPVPVYTGRNSFNFGGTVSGSSNNDSKDMLTTSPPSAGTEQYKFQQFINRHFNMIVPSNGGKWSNNEATQNVPTMTLVDKQLNYAQSHNMRARAHNLLWGDGTTGGNQQPTWVNTLIASAAGGNATAKTNLSNAITSRINYYAGTTGNRSLKYTEIDGLNESLHEPSYWNIYGATGLAGIYNQVQSAMTAVGSPAKVMLNEFNVLQFSPSAIDTAGVQSGSDTYANYYRNHIAAVRDAGGAMGGIGFQEYADVNPTPPSSASAMKALQNLSVHGLPLSLTEYGMASDTTKTESQTLGPDSLETAMRMMYGSPLGQTFMIWGWWDLTGSAYPPAALLDNTSGTGNNTVLTPMAARWESLMSQWNTNTTVTLAPDGTITFNGAYGDYYLAGQGANFSNNSILSPNVLPFDMTLTKGTTSYSTTLAKPPGWFFWKTNGSSAWGNTANWTDAPESLVAPNGAGLTAYFGSAATSYNLSSGAATNSSITTPSTVTVTTPVTVGMLAFDNNNAYTLNASGSGAITLQGYNNANGHVAAMYVRTGSHTINASLTLVDNTTVTVVPGAASLTATNLQPTSASLTKAGAGTFVVNNVRAASLDIDAGTVRVAPNGTNTGASQLANLTIDAGAKLNLTNNKLVLTDETVADVTALLASGRNGGTWDGSGIITSQTDALTGYTSIAIATADEIGRTGLPFAGITVSATDVLLMYTYGGDANLTGTVDVDDYGQIDFNSSIGGVLPGWYNGDFDYSGTVDVDDYGVIDFVINIQGPPFSTAPSAALSTVPEPALTFLALPLLLAQRRRSKQN